jgi:hypothetical protein
MAKGFIVCRDSSLFDIKRNTSVLLPRHKYMDLFGISRSLCIAVFGLGSDSGLVCISFKALPSNILGHLGSIITCAAVIGGEFLITGGGDCAIHVYELPEHVPVSQSALHSAPLIAIAGNLDLGMIASIDNDFYLVLETLFDHKFINFASIPRAAKKPLLTVFKSGIVVVAHDQFISFFDARAQLMAKIEEARDVIQIEKYYDLGKRELLIVARVGGSIDVIDLTTFEKLCAFPTGMPAPRMCPIKKRRCFVAVIGQEVGQWTLTSFDFSKYLTSIVRKTND